MNLHIKGSFFYFRGRMALVMNRKSNWMRWFMIFMVVLVVLSMFLSMFR